VDHRWLGQALSIFVPTTTRGCSRRGLLVVTMSAVVVAAAGETSVEVVLPEGRSCLQLSWSGGSWVVGVHAVCGPPHGNFTDDGEVRAAARRHPHGQGCVSAGLTSDLVGEAGD
jgi:hypothetical protein